MKQITLSIISVASLLAFSGCFAVSRGSHVLVGSQKPPVLPENVRIYLKPPHRYEVIALVNAKGHTDPMFPASDQAITDAAIMRLKKEAGQLGANGILLSGIGEQQSGTTNASVDTSSFLTRNTTHTKLNSTLDLNLAVESINRDKVVAGRAIFVSKD